MHKLFCVFFSVVFVSEWRITSCATVFLLFFLISLKNIFQDYQISTFNILNIKIHIVYILNLKKNRFKARLLLFVGKYMYC